MIGEIDRDVELGMRHRKASDDGGDEPLAHGRRTGNAQFALRHSLFADQRDRFVSLLRDPQAALEKYQSCIR